MVSSTEIKPSIQLQPYIQNFVYRELNESAKINRPLFATQDFMITFNLTQKKFGLLRSRPGEFPEPEQQLNSCIVIAGISSRFEGFMTSDGSAKLFSIYFTPVGFYQLFGVPSFHFTNVVEEDVYTCNKNLETLREQLIFAESKLEMVICCESFLIRQLAKSRVKDCRNSIQLTANQILVNSGNCSIEKLGYDYNMSMKTFERKFIEQVGCPPKLYSRIVRFNKALNLKMGNFQKSWTDIAHFCGYYDQMHFIRDFKLFSGTTPTDFFRQTPPVSEEMIDGAILL